MLYLVLLVLWLNPGINIHHFYHEKMTFHTSRTSGRGNKNALVFHIGLKYQGSTIELRGQGKAF
jgi:hypothetical protein